MTTLESFIMILCTVMKILLVLQKYEIAIAMKIEMVERSKEIIHKMKQRR